MSRKEGKRTEIGRVEKRGKLKDWRKGSRKEYKERKKKGKRSEGEGWRVKERKKER